MKIVEAGFAEIEGERSITYCVNCFRLFRLSEKCGGSEANPGEAAQFRSREEREAERNGLLGNAHGRGLK